MTSNGQIVLYAFDLLQLNGRDLTRLPLQERKSCLEALLKNSGVLFSPNLPGSIRQILKQAKALGLEGVVAKKADSVYEPGERTGAWVKLRLSQEADFVIGGFSPGSGGFDELLVGYSDGKKLMFCSRVRAGFTPLVKDQMWRLIKPLLTTKCPFVNLPSRKKDRWGEGITAEDMSKLRWVKPKIVVRIAFTEWTRDGHLRHSSFSRLK